MELQDCGDRADLASKVIALLEQDARVAGVEYYGSIANDTADYFSDVDLRVRVRDVSDREFAEALPELVQPIGSLLIAGWGLSALPDDYVRTFYFDDYPLFWHIDIACESAVHVDGSDIRGAYHWEQMFKIWIDVVSKLLRGEDATHYIEKFIGVWRDLVPVQDRPANEKLSLYLDWYAERARGKGAPCADVYQCCDALRREYLL